MSKKFRWFLLASCAFVIVMNGKSTLAMLAEGPQQDPSPERRASAQPLADRTPAPKPAQAVRPRADGELARGDARRP